MYQSAAVYTNVSARPAHNFCITVLMYVELRGNEMRGQVALGPVNVLKHTFTLVHRSLLDLIIILHTTQRAHTRAERNTRRQTDRQTHGGCESQSVSVLQ